MKKKVGCPKCGGYGFIAKWNDCSAWSEYCFECNGTGEVEVPFTIGDRIRSMSDEEIAAWLANNAVDTPCEIICGNECRAFTTLKKTSEEACDDIVKEWLKKEWRR